MLLLVQPNAVVPAHHLIDELWGDAPPTTAGNLIQGAVSHLRKVLGKDAIDTRGAGYALRAEPDALDLQRFERLAETGSIALADGHFDRAAATLAEALAEWRGPALGDLGDEAFVQPVAARLEELRLLAMERRLEAELGLGRHADVLGDIRELAHRHPLRERIHGLLMLALYRCGRQAEALEAYRSVRATLVEQLGISPGPALQGLEGRILRQDPELLPAAAGSATSVTAAPRQEPLRSILVAPLVPSSVDALIALAEPLALQPERELILVGTVPQGDRLASLSRDLEPRRESLVERGVSARAAAFTSVTPGADIARVAVEHEVDLVLVDAPDGLLEDARVLALFDQTPCDVGVVVGDLIPRRRTGGVRFSSRSEGPRTTGRRLSSARGWRGTCTHRCVSPAPRRAPTGATQAACSRVRRSPFSAPSACTRSRCSWNPTPTRSWPRRWMPRSWSWALRSAGGARVSGRSAPRSPRDVPGPRSSCAAAHAPEAWPLVKPTRASRGPWVPPSRSLRPATRQRSPRSCGKPVGQTTRMCRVATRGG